MRTQTDEKNPSWKGDEVGYYGLHTWVARKLGKPKKCNRCGTTKAKRYEWANISREYKRDLSDWERLCASCHRQDGFDSGEYVTWNKGLKIQTNTGRTHIKPGQRISKKTEFKKGFIPWNKYLEDKKCPKCKKQFHPRVAKAIYCGSECYWQSLRGKTLIKR